jgi:hypothetical protein
MSNVLAKRVLASHDKPRIRVSPPVIETAGLDAAGVFARRQAGELPVKRCGCRRVAHGLERQTEKHALVALTVDVLTRRQ